jgi:hypothetical protein
MQRLAGRDVRLGPLDAFALVAADRPGRRALDLGGAAQVFLGALARRFALRAAMVHATGGPGRVGHPARLLVRLAARFFFLAQLAAGLFLLPAGFRFGRASARWFPCASA